MTRTVAMQRKLILGNEYDDRLTQILMDVLKARGGRQRKNLWGVAGSQDLSILEVAIEGELVVVESETYIGLSIAGEESLVESIASDVERRYAGD